MFRSSLNQYGISLSSKIILKNDINYKDSLKPTNLKKKDITKNKENLYLCLDVYKKKKKKHVKLRTNRD